MRPNNPLLGAIQGGFKLNKVNKNIDENSILYKTEKFRDDPDEYDDNYTAWKVITAILDKNKYPEHQDKELDAEDVINALNHLDQYIPEIAEPESLKGEKKELYYYHQKIYYDYYKDAEKFLKEQIGVSKEKLAILFAKNIGEFYPKLKDSDIRSEALKLANQNILFSPAIKIRQNGDGAEDFIKKLVEIIDPEVNEHKELKELVQETYKNTDKDYPKYALNDYNEFRNNIDNFLDKKNDLTTYGENLNILKGAKRKKLKEKYNNLITSIANLDEDLNEEHIKQAIKTLNQERKDITCINILQKAKGGEIIDNHYNDLDREIYNYKISFNNFTQDIENILNNIEKDILLKKENIIISEITDSIYYNDNLKNLINSLDISYDDARKEKCKLALFAIISGIAYLPDLDGHELYINSHSRMDANVLKLNLAPENYTYPTDKDDEFIIYDNKNEKTKYKQFENLLKVNDFIKETYNNLSESQIAQFLQSQKYELEKKNKIEANKIKKEDELTKLYAEQELEEKKYIRDTENANNLESYLNQGHSLLTILNRLYPENIPAKDYRSKDSNNIINQTRIEIAEEIQTNGLLENPFIFEGANSLQNVPFIIPEIQEAITKHKKDNQKLPIAVSAEKFLDKINGADIADDDLSNQILTKSLGNDGIEQIEEEKRKIEENKEEQKKRRVNQQKRDFERNLRILQKKYSTSETNKETPDEDDENDFMSELTKKTKGTDHISLEVLTSTDYEGYSNNLFILHNKVIDKNIENETSNLTTEEQREYDEINSLILNKEERKKFEKIQRDIKKKLSKNESKLLDNAIEKEDAELEEEEKELLHNIIKDTILDSDKYIEFQELRTKSQYVLPKEKEERLDKLKALSFLQDSQKERLETLKEKAENGVLGQEEDVDISQLFEPFRDIEYSEDKQKAASYLTKLCFFQITGYSFNQVTDDIKNQGLSVKQQELLQDAETTLKFLKKPTNENIAAIINNLNSILTDLELESLDDDEEKINQEISKIVNDFELIEYEYLQSILKQAKFSRETVQDFTKAEQGRKIKASHATKINDDKNGETSFSPVFNALHDEALQKDILEKKEIYEDDLRNITELKENLQQIEGKLREEEYERASRLESINTLLDLSSLSDDEQIKLLRQLEQVINEERNITDALSKVVKIIKEEIDEEDIDKEGEKTTEEIEEIINGEDTTKEDLANLIREKIVEIKKRDDLIQRQRDEIRDYGDLIADNQDLQNALDAERRKPAPVAPPAQIIYRDRNHYSDDSDPELENENKEQKQKISNLERKLNNQQTQFKEIAEKFKGQAEEVIAQKDQKIKNLEQRLSNENYNNYAVREENEKYKKENSGYKEKVQDLYGKAQELSKLLNNPDGVDVTLEEVTTIFDALTKATNQKLNNKQEQKESFTGLKSIPLIGQLIAGILEAIMSLFGGGRNNKQAEDPVTNQQLAEAMNILGGMMHKLQNQPQEEKPVLDLKTPVSSVERDEINQALVS